MTLFGIAVVCVRGRMLDCFGGCDPSDIQPRLARLAGEYQARYEELDDESALDSAQCIEMFLAIVRDDLADPVLLKQQVQGMRLGDTGDSGRTEAPASLLARMSPQLVRMTEQGHLSRLGAVNMFIIALQPHPRHVLHPQGQAFVQRSKAAFARLAMPHHSEDSVELALGRAETAATQVYNELVGMLQLDQAAGKPTVAIGVNTTDLLGQLKGGDASAVKAAQRLMKQLGNALHASMPPPRPAPSQLQWCENHQRWTGHSTAECHIGMQGQPRPAPSTAPTHVNASSPQPAEQALFEQFRLFMATRPPAAAPLRAHTAMQPRGGPPRSRLHCDHCDKDGHTEDRCYSKHPELRPVHWGPPAPTHALVAAEGMVEDEGAAMHSFTSVPITSPEHALEAMRHALAAAADRPTSFTPGSASARSPPAAPQPERVVLADITNIVHALDQRVTGMQQSLLIVEAQVAQLRAQQPLAQGVVAAQSAQNSSASASLPPASYIRAGAPPPQALPFAANPSVHAGLSVLDRHGNPHAIPGVMIDSGSGAQLMTAGLAKQLQLEVLPTQLRIIQSGGTTFQTLGAVVVEVGLALGTPHAARSRHRVHIVEEHSSLPYTLVIGTEVMLRHGIQIDLPGRLLTYAPQLASHAHPQPRHALPLHFEPPAEWSSATMLSQCSLADPSSLMQGSPLWACMASPVISGGAEGSSGHTSACYLGVPEGKPSAASATSGCSHTPSVAEDQPGVEIRGPPLAPRSKPGRGMDRQQLPTRTPKHQPLGLGAARRRDRKQRAKAPTPLLERWSTAGKGLLDAMRKGCTLRNACAFLLILCALLPTMHACPPQQPQEVPALPCLFSCVTIAHTLPDGHQHLPPDARFTKHPKGMLFGHHPDMTAAQHHQLQAVIEAHDNAFSYSLSDLPGYHVLRVTSPHHPQADGLAERAVQTFKDALRKHIAVSGDPAAWDEALPAIALGYRVSPQEATKCSPYSLLYGRAPVLPPAVVQRMVRPVNLDDPVVAAHDLLERSAVLSRETAAAMGNIRIAQHRDTLRYATTHSGSYKPAVRQLHPGSFVWTQRPQSNTLQLSARPEIYRVVSVGVNGVAKLQGKCGRVMAENVCNLAPCCIGNGLTTQEVQRRTQDVAHQPQTSPLQEAFTTKQGRDRAQAAQLLHGRVARQPGTSRWGVVRFKGQQCHPHYFAVDWADGTITDKAAVPLAVGPAAMPLAVGPAAVPLAVGQAAVPLAAGPAAVPLAVGQAAVPLAAGMAYATPNIGPAHTLAAPCKRTKANRANLARGHAAVAAATAAAAAAAASTATAATEAEGVRSAAALQECEAELQRCLQALQRSENEVQAVQVALHRSQAELAAMKQELSACQAERAATKQELAASQRILLNFIAYSTPVPTAGNAHGTAMATNKMFLCENFMQPSMQPDYFIVVWGQDPVGARTLWCGARTLWCQDPVVWCQDPVVWGQDPVVPGPCGVGPGPCGARTLWCGAGTLWCQDPVVWGQDPVVPGPCGVGPGPCGVGPGPCGARTLWCGARTLWCQDPVVWGRDPCGARTPVVWGQDPVVPGPCGVGPGPCGARTLPVVGPGPCHVVPGPCGVGPGPCGARTLWCGAGTLWCQDPVVWGQDPVDPVVWGPGPLWCQDPVVWGQDPVDPVVWCQDPVVWGQDPVGVGPGPCGCQDPVVWGQDPVVPGPLWCGAGTLWCQDPVVWGQDPVVPRTLWTLWCQDPAVWGQDPVDPVVWGQDPVVRCQDPVVPGTLWTLWCQDPVVWGQDPVGQDPVDPCGVGARTLWCQDPVVWCQDPVVWGQDPVVPGPCGVGPGPCGARTLWCGAMTLWTLWCQDPVVWGRDPVVPGTLWCWGQDPVVPGPCGLGPGPCRTLWCQNPVVRNQDPVVWGQDPVVPGPCGVGPGPCGARTLWCGARTLWCQDPVGVQQDPVGPDPGVRCQDPVGQDPVVWCQDPVVWGQDPVVPEPCGEEPGPCGVVPGPCGEVPGPCGARTLW
ncbi:hypothetical protein QJQ45_022904 [Haematococcus lacustris]|nr:hypothetical protein QJQ45_022904 [Haematococcus lacustris]